MRKSLHVWMLTSTLLFFFTLSNLSAQNIYYHYGQEKVILEPISSRLLVKFTPEVSFGSQESILSDPILKPIIRPKVDGRPNIVILETKQGTTLQQLMQYISRIKENETILSASPYFKFVNAPGLAAYTDEILVQLKSANDLQLLMEEAATLKLVYETPEFFNPNQYLVKVTKETQSNAVDIANLLHESGKFAYVEPNLDLFDVQLSNDGLFPVQWYLRNTGTGTSSNPGNTAQWGGTNDADIDANDAWLNSTGNRVSIAIVDDGVRLNHPDLAPGVRLLNGYDAIGTNSTGTYTGGDFHGTACAGIAAATKDNTIGIAGVAPEATIIPIRIFNGSSTTFAAVIKAFNIALCKNIDVISNSYGGGSGSLGMTDAINNAATIGRQGKGAIVVCGSGNDNLATVIYPASLPKVIAVGATSMCNERKNPNSCDGEDNWGSNYGTQLDIVAPGVKMMTTDIGSNNYLPDFWGTSAATPVVAGVAALVLSIDLCFTGAEVKEILERSASKVGGYSYSSGYPNGLWNNEMGYGLVNARDAVLEAINRGPQQCPEVLLWEGCFPPKDRLANPSLENSIVKNISYFPNPFSNSISFSYELTTTSSVSLLISDPLGRTVAALSNNEVQISGEHEVNYATENLPSGLYLFTLTVGDISHTYKLVKTN